MHSSQGVSLSKRVKNGYTLVELSIVLIIIGLLVGAVVEGGSLIKAQELRTMMNTASAYNTAVSQFQIKYGFLPGDFPTATLVWGSDSANCTSARDIAGGTCNGDGDGLISANASATTDEHFRAWQMLALSSLIANGSYAGHYLAALPGLLGAGNVPLTVRSGGAYSIYMTNEVNNSQAADTSFYDGSYNGSIIMGTPLSSGTNAAKMFPSAGLLTGVDAAAIDTKMDDGSPGTGAVKTFKPAAPSAIAVANTCATSVAGIDSYVLSGGSSKVCALIFMSDLNNKNQR